VDAPRHFPISLVHLCVVTIRATQTDEPQHVPEQRKGARTGGQGQVEGGREAGICTTGSTTAAAAAAGSGCGMTGKKRGSGGGGGEGGLAGTRAGRGQWVRWGGGRGEGRHEGESAHALIEKKAS